MAKKSSPSDAKIRYEENDAAVDLSTLVTCIMTPSSGEIVMRNQDTGQIGEYRFRAQA